MQSNIMAVQGPSVPDTIFAAATLWREVVCIAETAEKDRLADGGYPDHYAETVAKTYEAIRCHMRNFGEFGLQEIVVSWGPVFVNALEYLTDGATFRASRDRMSAHVFLMRGIDWNLDTPKPFYDGIETWLNEVRAKRHLVAKDRRAFSDVIYRAPTAIVALWTHRHGTGAEVCMTQDEVGEERCAIAATQWDNEFPDEAPPEEPTVLADRYFERMQDHEGFEAIMVRMEMFR